ncbi:hypothetical protein TRVA0_005S01948 [Trichomonascus vanleenenianus]|uniref:Crt10p n=1 Tax=Trichomonascus vanleenenianus TaxID=2268995 RepID=UPI003EC9BF51
MDEDPERAWFEDILSSEVLNASSGLAHRLPITYCGKVRLKVNGGADTSRGVRSEPFAQLFRNNLAASCDKYPLFFLAIGSILAVYEYDIVAGQPQSCPSLKIDLKPSQTTDAMIQGANWEDDPHGTNFIKVGLLSEDEPVVATASDNGKVHIWIVSDLFDTIQAMKHDNKDPSQRQVLLVETDPAVKPLVSFQMDSSAWGIDFEPRQQLVAISDNTHKVTVYVLKGYLKTRDVRDIQRVIMPTMKHNIPDVQFVIPDGENERLNRFLWNENVNFHPEGRFHLACISILGQVHFIEGYYGTFLDRHRARLAGSLSQRPYWNREVDETVETSIFRDAFDHDIFEESDSGSGSSDELLPRQDTINVRSLLLSAMNELAEDATGIDVTVAEIDRREQEEMSDDDSEDDVLQPALAAESRYADEETQQEEDEPMEQSINYSISNTPVTMPPSTMTRDRVLTRHNAHFVGIYIYKKQIGQFGWTINAVRAKDFKQVDSLRHLNLKPSACTDEAKYLRFLGKRSRRLRADHEFFRKECWYRSKYGVPDYSLYPASRFESFEIPCAYLWGAPPSSGIAESLELLTADARSSQSVKEAEAVLSSSDSKHNMHKEMYCMFGDQFFVTTSQHGIHLNRVNDYSNNAYNTNIFNFSGQFRFQGELNRLSIVQVVPQLSLVIAVSQAHIVGFFRMVKYRDLYTLRQERLIPVRSSQQFEQQIIVGAAVTSLQSQHGEFKLHLLYNDRTLITLDLRETIEKTDIFEDII